MTLQVFIDGKPVDHRNVNVHADRIEGATGTFTIDPGVNIERGDLISVVYESNELASGIVTSVSGGTGTFASPVFSPRRAISRADQAIIDQFVIDSLARGFARGS